MEQLKVLWEKKPFKYGVIIVGAVVVFIIVAQLNNWLTG